MGRTESMLGVEVLARQRVLFLLLSVVSAGGEEFFYRGVLGLLGGTAPGSSLWQPLLLQAVFYGANHLAFGAPAVVGKTGLGLGLGAAALGGGLACSVLAHLAYQILVLRQFPAGGRTSEAAARGTA